MHGVKLSCMGDPVQEMIEHTTRQLLKVAEAVRETPAGQQFLRLAMSLEVLTERPAPSLSDVLHDLDSQPRGVTANASAGEITIETKTVPDDTPPKRLSVRSKLRKVIRSEAKGWSYDDVMDYWEDLGDPIDKKPPVRNAANALRNKEELVNDPDTNLMWHPPFYEATQLPPPPKLVGLHGDPADPDLNGPLLGQAAGGRGVYAPGGSFDDR